MRISHPSFYLVVRHIVIEADAYPVFAAHVVGSADSHITGFQLVRLFRIALDCTGVETVDVEKTENFAVHIERQYGLRGAKRLKRHLLAAVRQREAKFPELFDIHRRNDYQTISFAGAKSLSIGRMNDHVEWMTRH